MKKVSRSVAMLLALLMLVSVLPMSAFAAEATPVYEGEYVTVPAKGHFDLVVGEKDVDGKDVNCETDHKTVPSGKELSVGDGDMSKGIYLDWDSLFDGITNDTGNNMDISYVLKRDDGVMVEIGEDEMEADYTHTGLELSLWDGGKVDVLVVYPQVWVGGDTGFDNSKANVMGDWLNGQLENESGTAGKGLFNIDSVMLADATKKDPACFNENYNKILFDENGEYKYDVILFGTWDANGGTIGANDGKDNVYGYAGAAGDLTEGAKNAVRAFIQAGGGVLFGHDTITSDANNINPNFNSFAGELGITLGDQDAIKAQFDGASYEITEYVEVTSEEGLLTRYPWTLTGSKLKIPATHTLWQIVDSKSDNAPTVWMKLLNGTVKAEDGKITQQGGEKPNRYADLGNGKSSDYYLITNENVAMIQTGHSNGKASDDERKVFANTMFYLLQKSLKSVAFDYAFADVAVPVVNETEEEIKDTMALIKSSLDPKAELGTEYNGSQTYSATVDFSGMDIGTPYKYYVEATGLVQGETQKSNDLEVVAFAGLEGFIIRVDSSKNTRDSLISKYEADDAGVDYKTVTENGAVKEDAEVTAYTMDSITGTSTKLDTETTYYLHIIPVDQSGNKGKLTVVEFKLADIYEDPEIITDVEAVPEEKDDNVPEDSRVDKDAEGNVDDVYYYPHNYEDKEGNPFDELQEDDKVEISVSATVETLERDDVVGVVTLVKWKTDDNGNIVTENGKPVVERTYTVDNLEELANIDPALEFGKTTTEDIELDIDKIYGPEIEYNDEIYNDYETNGEYTITIDWYEQDENGDPTGEPIVTDETDFTLVQPDYKVEYTYKDYDEDDKIVEVTEEFIVKYGEPADKPDAPKVLRDNAYNYYFKDWTMTSGGESIDRITEDSSFEGKYSKLPRGTAPEQPEDDPIVDDSKEVELERLGGEDRIETAIKISQEGWDKADVVILATANQFPDAMAGVPLAKAVDAPILLTYNRSSLEVEVKAEIARLSPEKVYILGQTEAVNANIEAELKALYEVERVGGKDRFGTAVQIANEMEEVYGEKPDAVYFVRSDLFPDALSVSPVAAIERNPILYVAPNGTVEALTAEYSKTIGTEATIIGGPEAVTEVGENNIKALYKSVDRIYGSDRYATSVEVCNAKEKLFTGDYTCLATGKKFPDALTGGSFAAKNNCPVLLVNGSVSPELAVYLANRPITKLYVFGGELAVSEEIAQTALDYCRYKYY